LRILVFHGYLLHGTGSNVYNARLAAALVRAGHEVHLLCQDRRPADLDWVDATGEWGDGGLAVVKHRPPARATVYRPDIGGLLPVYVADDYEGVTARPFHELSDDELEHYLDANVDAVRDVCAIARPDVALANHLVMGPAVLARALAGTGVPYAVKIHGSALEYTVKPHPRFLPFAREGLDGATAVLVGSRHTAESLWAAIGDRGLPERTRLGPPGVDVDLFAPRTPERATAGVRALRVRIAAVNDAETGSFARDGAAAASALGEIDPDHERIVVYLGKLIASKGVELLLAAWPLVTRARPDARLVIVGFGAWRSGLEALATDLASGDVDAALARRAEDGRELPELAAFLRSMDRAAYAEGAGALRTKVTWAGRLDHPELADLLPAAAAVVVPSTFPEAFGMVAAEAAASGALPIVANHSGLAEVVAALGEQVPPEARAWLSFDVGDDAVHQLAACLTGWLDADDELRSATRDAIVEVTRARWSWDGVARTVIAAASGDLDDLPRP